MSKSFSVCMLLLVVTLVTLSMVNSDSIDITTNDYRVEIVDISCDSSCSTCASLNSFYFETEGNMTSFAVMGEATTMVWEVYVPTDLTSTEVDLKFVIGTDMLGFPLEFPVIDKTIGDICNSGMAVPIDDNQECGMAGNYMFSIDFTVPPNPLDMPLSGLELTGPAILTNNLNTTLANCTVDLVLE